MSFLNILYRLSGHAELDELEVKFTYGDKIEVTNGFFKGQKGIATQLHPASSLLHGWVGYWVRLDDGTEPNIAIPVRDLKKIA